MSAPSKPWWEDGTQVADKIQRCTTFAAIGSVVTGAMPTILAALRAPQNGGVEAMRTELRPFAEGDGEGLDEVVIYGSHIVHAETMSDTALWIGIHDQAGGLVHIWVNAVRRKGRLGIVMTATDEGERGTIGQGAAKPLNPETQEAGDVR